MLHPSSQTKGPVWFHSEEKNLSREEIAQAIRTEVDHRIIEENMDIPMLPMIAAEALSLIKNPKAGIDDVSTLIGKDQYMAGRLIQIANSPLYRNMYEVTNILRAVSLIGLRGVTELIFSLSIKGSIFKNEVFADRMSRLWQHSIGCAFLAQEIGRKHGGSADNNFLIGLLHDIGKPLIVDTIAKMTERHPEKYPREMVDEDLVEGIMTKFHVRVGGLIGNKWAFPENLLVAIANHHNPFKDGIVNQGALLAGIADLFCHQLGLGDEPNGKDLSGHPWIQALKITPEEYKDIETNLAGNAKMIVTNVFSI